MQLSLWPTLTHVQRMDWETAAGTHIRMGRIRRGLSISASFTDGTMLGLVTCQVKNWCVPVSGRKLSLTHDKQESVVCVTLAHERLLSVSRWHIGGCYLCHDGTLEAAICVTMAHGRLLSVSRWHTGGCYLCHAGTRGLLSVSRCHTGGCYLCHASTLEAAICVTVTNGRLLSVSR